MKRLNYILSIVALTNSKTLSKYYKKKKKKKKKASILYEKLIRFEDSYWREYQLKNRNLKTWMGFFQRVLAHGRIFKFHREMQLLMKPINPMELLSIKTNMNLTQFVSKKNVSSDVQKCIFLVIALFLFLYMVLATGNNKKIKFSIDSNC